MILSNYFSLIFYSLYIPALLMTFLMIKVFKLEGEIESGISFTDFKVSSNTGSNDGGASVAMYSAFIEDLIIGYWLAT